MQLWEIFVPTVRSNGKPYKLRFHKVWDQKVKDLVGGLSVLPKIKGYWLSPKQELFVEEMIPIRIMCSEEQIENIVIMSLDYYEQEGIMYYLVTNDVRIKYSKVSENL